MLALFLATAVSVAPQAADEIKSGRWEFTTQMQLPGAVQSAPAGQAAGGNAPMTRTACINAANPIPDEAQCKVDRVDRRGPGSQKPHYARNEVARVLGTSGIAAPPIQ